MHRFNPVVGRGDHKPGLVLVVEDEELIRSLLHESLADDGYEVIEAGTECEAVDLLARRPVDILLTDIDLDRGGEGVALAQRARAIDPQIGVIYASGLSSPPEAARVPGAWFMPKPYDLNAMSAAVAVILSRRMH